MLPTHRAPTSPGEMLEEEFLKPMGMAKTTLAEKLGVHPNVVSAIVSGRRAISPEMAVKLGRAFDMSPQFWAGLQVNLDLWHAQKKLGPAPRTVKASKASPPRRAAR